MGGGSYSSTLYATNHGQAGHDQEVDHADKLYRDVLYGEPTQDWRVALVDLALERTDPVSRLGVLNLPLVYNMIPAAHAQSEVTVRQDETRTIQFSINDTDGDPITYVAIGGNATVFASIDYTKTGAAATGNVILAPTAADVAGIYELTLIAVSDTVHEGSRFNALIFAIEVLPASSLFIAPIDDVTIKETESTIIPVNVSDSSAIISIQDGGSGITAISDNMVTLAPRPGDAGIYTITVVAAAGDLVAFESFTVRVTTVDPPAIDIIPDVTMKHSEVESVNFNVDGDGDPLVLLIRGTTIATLHNRTVILNPGATDVGTHMVTLVATTGELLTMRSFMVTVTDDAPTIGTIQNVTMSHVQMRSIDVPAADADGDEIVLSMTGNGTDFASIFSNGTLILKPGRDNIEKNYTIRAIATANGKTATTLFGVSVVADMPPEIAPIKHILMSYIETREIPINATDPDGDEIIFGIGGETADFMEIRNATLFLEPIESDVNFDGYHVNVTANALGKSAYVNLTIYVTDDRLIVRADDVTLRHDQNATVQVVTLHEEPDAVVVLDPILSDIATLNATTGEIFIDPTPDDVGEHVIAVSASTVGDEPDHYEMELMVNVTDDAPVIEEISDVGIFYGNTKEIPIRVSDTEGDPITIRVVGHEMGKFDAKENLLVISPKYNDLRDAPYEFTIIAEANGLQNQASFEVTVLDLIPIIHSVSVDGKRTIPSENLDMEIILMGDRQVRMLYFNITDPKNESVVLAALQGNGNEITTVDPEAHTIRLDPEEGDTGLYEMTVIAIAGQNRLSEPLTIHVRVSDAPVLISKMDDMALQLNDPTRRVLIDAHARNGVLRYNVAVQDNPAKLEGGSLVSWSPTSTRITIDPSDHITGITRDTPYRVNVTAYLRDEPTTRAWTEFDIGIYSNAASIVSAEPFPKEIQPGDSFVISYELVNLDPASSYTVGVTRDGKTVRDFVDVSKNTGSVRVDVSSSETPGTIQYTFGLYENGEIISSRILTVTIQETSSPPPPPTNPPPTPSAPSITSATPDSTTANRGGTLTVSYTLANLDNGVSYTVRVMDGTTQLNSTAASGTPGSIIMITIPSDEDRVSVSYTFELRTGSTTMDSATIAITVVDPSFSKVDLSSLSAYRGEMLIVSYDIIDKQVGTTHTVRVMDGATTLNFTDISDAAGSIEFAIPSDESLGGATYALELRTGSVTLDSEDLTVNILELNPPDEARYSAQFSINVNNSMSGLVVHDDKIYVTDFGDATGDSAIFVYNATDGSYLSKLDLVHTNPANDLPVGITIYDNNLYTIDFWTEMVFAYDINGTFNSSFSLSENNAHPEGITEHHGNFYVVDSNKTRVFYYPIANPDAREKSFDLAPANSRPTGIAAHGGVLYVVNEQSGGADSVKIYLYSVTGAFLDTLPMERYNTNPTGIAVYDGKIYVSDVSINEGIIYVYDIEYP